MKARQTLAAIALLLAATGLRAQQGAAAPADTARWHLDVSTGAALMSGFGQRQGLQWVAPQLELRPTSQLTVRAGFALTGNFVPGGYRVRAYTPDLAPRRQGTQATALWAAARCQVSDRLAVWGAVAHASGFVQPLWADASQPLDVTAVSGGVQYALDSGRMLELHFHFARDRYGNALAGPWGWHGGGMYGPYGPYPMGATLFDTAWDTPYGFPAF